MRKSLKYNEKESFDRLFSLFFAADAFGFHHSAAGNG